MAWLFWDASALVKRYTAEVGRDTANALFHLNATDAAILTSLLEHLRAPPDPRSGCVLVASDRRLLRAAGAEGLVTLNPETVPAADVPAFLAYG